MKIESKKVCFYCVDFGRSVKSWANAWEFNELKHMTSFRFPLLFGGVMGV